MSGQKRAGFGPTLTCVVAGGLAVGASTTYAVSVQPIQTGTFNATGVVTATGDSNTANNGPAVTTVTVVRAYLL